MHIDRAVNVHIAADPQPFETLDVPDGAERRRGVAFFCNERGKGRKPVEAAVRRKPFERARRDKYLTDLPVILSLMGVSACGLPASAGMFADGSREWGVFREAYTQARKNQFRACNGSLCDAILPAQHAYAEEGDRQALIATC